MNIKERVFAFQPLHIKKIAALAFDISVVYLLNNLIYQI